MIRDYLRLLRPHQYIKNLFVLIPAFFAFKLHDTQVWQSGILVFSSFCLIASSIYILNDWIDRHDDAQHPEKRFRPLASGQLGLKPAVILFLLSFFSGLYLAVNLSQNVVALLLFYFFLNIFYCLKLKHIAIVDIVIISSGFVIRLLVGAEATQVDLSHWIIVMTFLLALFLALAKRRDDLVIMANTDKKMRKVVDGYNLRFLDTSMIMTSSIVIVAYILWSISAEVIERIDSQNLYLTAIFVLLGVLRYMQITFVEEKSGNPSRVLSKDIFIQIVLILWAATFFFIIYL